MQPVWFGNEPRIAGWVASKIETLDGTFENVQTLGVLHNDKLVAGVVYHDWAPSSETIEFSVASEDKRWLTRPVLFAMFAYPFIGLKCQMVCVRTSQKNHNEAGRGVNRLAQAYGFQTIEIPRLFGRHHDGFLHTLTEEAWRTNGFHKEHQNGEI